MVLIILVDLIRPPSPEARLEALRGDLREARAAADSCRAALDREEASLLAGDARLDSLRTEIERYESLDPRGVPAAEYDAYIAAFDAYNASIPDRKNAAARLQANWVRCRAITETHNEMADSARDFAVEAGLLPSDTPGDRRGATTGGAEASGQPPDVP